MFLHGCLKTYLKTRLKSPLTNQKSRPITVSWFKHSLLLVTVKLRFQNSEVQSSWLQNKPKTSFLDLKREPKPWKKQCKHCKSGTGYPVAQPEDIPAPLQNLSTSTVEALRPLTLDQRRRGLGRGGLRQGCSLLRRGGGARGYDRAALLRRGGMGLELQRLGSGADLAEAPL